MNRKLTSVIILFSIACCAFSQEKSARIPREGRNAEKRLEWLIRRKQDPAVRNPENARWNAYLQSQSRLMNTSRTPVANWQCLGPDNQGGRVISHAFDPFDSQTLWVGSASGGLWKTSDGAVTWTAMTDQIPNLAIGAVAIQPGNSNVMLIGTGEGYLLSPWLQYGIGVLRSTDGGNTWNPTGLTVDDSLQFASLGFAWDPQNTNNVYIATTYGIFVSTDAGQNWTLTLGGIATSIVINKKSPANVYAAIQDYSGSTGGIYHSSDYGITWTQLTAGLPASVNTGFTSLAICDSFPTVIYAGISKPAADPNCGVMEGLFKTSNSGASWSLMPTGGQDFFCYPPPFNTICLGWYANTLHVASADSNRVFIGGVYLYQTADGGVSWNYSDWAPAESPAWMHPDHHSFGISPFNPNIMYSFNDGGVFKSTDAGNSWVKKPAGMVTTQFYSIASSPADKNLMTGGTQDNGVFFNSNINATQSWVSKVPGDGFTCIMDPVDPNTWYTSEMFNGRLKTIDAGATFDTIQTGIADPTYFFVAMSMDPANNQVMYTGTDVNIYKTTNAGSSWTSISNKPYISSIAIDKMNSNLLYICNDPALAVSYIYRSTNAGASWTFLGGPGDKVTDMETDPNVTGIVYVVRGTYAAGQQVFKSVNSGTSWTNITGDLPAIPVNTIAIDRFNSNHIYIGTDLGVYLTTNGGANWNPFNDNLPLVCVQDMHYYPGDSTIRIGTQGRGVWKTRTALAVSVNEKPDKVPEFSVQPNPARGNITITYQLEREGKVSGSVFNSLGQKVAELINEEKVAGKHSFTWDRKNSKGQPVMKGIYYVRIVYDGMACSRKIVLL